MLGYRVPAPDEAMLISGGKIRGGTPFRVVTGHGAVVMPFFRKVRFLTLAMCEAEVEETCVTHQGISLNVRAVIAFKVGNDPESIINAGQRFLSDQNQMSVLTGRIFAGHLRSIIGSLTVEQIIQERQKLAIEVLDGSKEEMARIGLTVDALQIQSIDDGKLGYILAIAAPHNAAIQRQAQIAQAQANQAAAEAEQISQRNQAEYARQTAVVQAQYRAEVDTAQAEAAQAGPLAKAQAQRSVIAAQTELAQREAELRQQQLVAEVVKPAEAEAERVRILAVADAEKMKIQAEAAASAGLTTSATSCCWRSSASRWASSVWAAMTLRWACAFASGPACAASACAVSTSARYWACTTAVCRAYSAWLRWEICSASAAAWFACACAICACRWMAALCGAAIAKM